MGSAFLGDGPVRFRALVVEDEEGSRDRLLRMLSSWENEIEVLGCAASGPSCLAMIERLRPDLLFLDIDLPGLNGFQVMDRLKSRPAVIYTSANASKVLQAYGSMAIDYLLKPIGPEELKRSVSKLKQAARSAPAAPDPPAQAVKPLYSPYLHSIPCMREKKIRLVGTGEIHYFQSDRSETLVYTSGPSFSIATSLEDLEKQLDPADFIRIHQSTLVNVAWIGEVRRLFEGKFKVILLDKLSTELAASRLYAENLRSLR